MYRLKKPTNNVQLPPEITDDQYQDLGFFRKWKYEYFVKSFTKTTPINARPYSKAYQTPQQTTIVNNTTIIEDDYNPTSGIVTGMILEDLLNSSNQQNSVDYNDQQTPQNTEPFGGFNGGDMGGGGSSGSWDAPDTSSQDNSNTNNSYSDTSSNDYSSSSDTSSYDSSSSDSSSSDSSGGGDW